MTLTAHFTATDTSRPVGDLASVEYQIDTADVSGWYSRQIDWGDGTVEDEMFAEFIDLGFLPTSPTTRTHVYLSVGDYDVSVAHTAWSDPGATVTIDTTAHISVGPAAPINNAFLHATRIPLSMEPGQMATVPLEIAGATYETDELTGLGIYGTDWKGIGSVWYWFELPQNANLWFSFRGPELDWGDGIDVRYVVHRRENLGFAGLWPVMMDNFVTDNVYLEEQVMTFLADGRFNDDEFGDAWIGLTLNAGVYYVQVVAEANCGDLLFDMHAEVLSGPGNEPEIYLNHQPGNGGEHQLPVPVATAKQATIFAVELVTENWDVGYMTCLLAHTDEDGLFFYRFGSPTGSWLDWDSPNDTELNYPAPPAVLPDGSLTVNEYSAHDQGAGRARWVDGIPTEEEFLYDGEYRNRWRAVAVRRGQWSTPRAMTVPNTAEWVIDGFRLTDDSFVDWACAHPARNSYFAFTRDSDSSVTAPPWLALIEWDKDGNLLSHHNYADPPVTSTTGYRFGSPCALPDAPNSLYAVGSSSGYGTYKLVRIHLDDYSVDEIIPASTYGGLDLLFPVIIDGVWAFGTGEDFGAAGDNLYIIDRTGALLRTISSPPFPSAATDWGSPTCRVLGAGQEGTRIWISAFQPLVDPFFPDSFPTGHSEFGTWLAYYDIADDEWTVLGYVFDGQTDNYGVGGSEVHYFDFYGSSSGLVVPLPPGLADASGDDRVHFRAP